MICFMPEHPECKKMKNKINSLFESIMEFRNNEGDYYIKFSYLDRIEKLIDNLNKKLNETNQIDKKTIVSIQCQAQMEIDVFRIMINNLLESQMFKSANEYSLCKPEEFKTCDDVIQKAIRKKDIRKETFYIKEKYMNRILDEISKDIYRIIIQKELTDIFRIRFEAFQSYISEKIKIERLHSILGLDFSMIENEKSDLTKLILSGLDQKFNESDYDIKNVNLFELANNLFNPGFREFFLAYICIKSLRLDRYIDIFPHKIDNNEFISITLKHIMDNKDSIITASVDQFEKFLFNGIVKKIENAREMNEEISDIDKKIRRYRTSECLYRNKNPEISYKTIYEKIDREEFIFLDPDLLKFFEGFIDSRI